MDRKGIIQLKDQWKFVVTVVPKLWFEMKYNEKVMYEDQNFIFNTVCFVHDGNILRRWGLDNKFSSHFKKEGVIFRFCTKLEKVFYG